MNDLPASKAGFRIESGWVTAIVNIVAVLVFFVALHFRVAALEEDKSFRDQGALSAQSWRDERLQDHLRIQWMSGQVSNMQKDLEKIKEAVGAAR